MLDLIIGEALPWILGGATALLGAVGLYLKGKSSGKNAEKNKRTKQRLEGIKEARKVEREIGDADRDAVIDINSKP